MIPERLQEIASRAIRDALRAGPPFGQAEEDRVELLAFIQRIAEAGCLSVVWDCFYCGCPLSPPVPHAPACPAPPLEYLKRFLDGWERGGGA